jgi:AraC-like DNA-binding protein
MYQLRRPAPPLLPFIEHYWFVSADDGPVDLRVDAYVDARADLIFNFGAPYLRAGLGGAETVQQGSNLDAQRTVPIRITQRGLVRTTGVRFRLGGLGAFTATALRPWTNLTPPPNAVLGSTIVTLEQQLAAEPDLDTQAHLLDAWFLQALQLDPGRRPFERALDLLVRSHGAATVEAAAQAADTSVRQVERLFARHLGIPPKTTGRILRFQTALRALMHDPDRPLSDVGASAGYFDQAHFIRDFRRMTGGVPRGYRGYYPPQGPAHFAPNVVVFVQSKPPRQR